MICISLNTPNTRTISLGLMVRVSDIPESQIEFSAIRASGPGGAERQQGVDCYPFEIRRPGLWFTGSR